MHKILATTTILLFAAALPAQPPGPWTTLFDGADLSAWRGYRSPDFPTRGWVVEGGTLRHVKGAGGGDLVTRARFENFELALRYRVGPASNSGVMYLVTEEASASYMTGPEFQVLDDRKAKGTDPRHLAGALYGLHPATGKTLKPTGEWNDARIVVRDRKVEHWLNGTRVVAYDLDSEDFRTRIAQSKFAKWAGFAKARSGHVALQDHGDDVWYSDIRIREWPSATKPRVLFDGKTLTGWKGWLRDGSDQASVWSVSEAGTLVCKGKPAGYIKTEESFRNYVLELEWRWTAKPGNSGVLCRVSGEDRIWPRSVEAQLMSGNAGDIWNIGEVPMRADPVRTRGRRTAKFRGAENPPGEWNRYRITLDGDRFLLEVNGHVVNEVVGVESLSGPIALQSEGAPIEFRSIRITPIDRP